MNLKRITRKFSTSSLTPYSLALILFLSLLTCRLWFFIRGLDLADSSTINLVRLFLIGMTQDALIPLAWVMIFQSVQKFYSDLFKNLRTSILILLMIVVYASCAYSFSNVEYFMSFGNHMNLDHISHLTQSKNGIELFVTDNKLTLLSLCYWAAFPIISLILACWTGWFRVELNLKTKASRWITSTLFILFLSCSFFHHSDPQEANFVQNSLVEFLKESLMPEDSIPSGKGKIQDILDPSPLPKPNENSQPWIFFDSKFPLMKATTHHLCQLGLRDKKTCSTDMDNDGVPVMNDCNDWDSRIHPGGRDIPGDTIDQDCSGLDDNPPNIIFIFWEGARAVNVGSIGYSTPATPQFDRLATSEGVLFRNAYTNSPQTRWSILPIFASAYDRLSTKWVSRHNPYLNLLSFTEVLSSRGYHTAYIHSGNLSISNISDRMSRWFDTFSDSNSSPINQLPKVGWSATDRDLFDLAYERLKNGSLKPPFFFGIQTGSLHYPFPLPEHKFAIGDHRDRKNKVANIMRYSDHYMGNFIEKIIKDPSFNNTLFIIAPDHGMNYYAPHGTGSQGINYEDLMWIPMTLIGKNWGIPHRIDNQIRQLVDIAPTILDRLGIDIPNPFVGRSLLREFHDRTPRAFFMNPNGGLSAGLREGNWKFWMNFKTQEKRLYELKQDPHERTNLAQDEENQVLVNRFTDMVKTVYSQNNQLIKNNRIYDPKFFIEPLIRTHTDLQGQKTSSE